MENVLGSVLKDANYVWQKLRESNNRVMQIKERKHKRPELLAPGGNLTSAIVAVLYGADAVYVGVPGLSLRDGAANLRDEELAYFVHFAHLHGSRVYVTLNIFARNEHIRNIILWLEYVSEIGVDALIVSDPGVIRLCCVYAPNIPIHLSTQANTTNRESLCFWKEAGISRVNLARELSFEEVREVCQNPPVEIEIFVHGAMCVSYSGRCLLSAVFTGRSANLGMCTHPCRWSYRIIEQTRPSEEFSIVEEPMGSYILNSEDLCLVDKLGDILVLGVDAFKIEGRMKSFLYVATVTNVYRRAVDAWIDGTVSDEMLNIWCNELDTVSHRPYTWGFMFSKENSQIDPSGEYRRKGTLAGIVIPSPEQRLNLDIQEDMSSKEMVYLQVRHTLDVGQNLTFLFPDGSIRTECIKAIEAPYGGLLKRAHPGMIVRVPINSKTFPYQVVRMELDADASPVRV